MEKGLTYVMYEEFLSIIRKNINAPSGKMSTDNLQKNKHKQQKSTNMIILEIKKNTIKTSYCFLLIKMARMKK